MSLPKTTCLSLTALILALLGTSSAVAQELHGSAKVIHEVQNDPACQKFEFEREYPAYFFGRGLFAAKKYSARIRFEKGFKGLVVSTDWGSTTTYSYTLYTGFSSLSAESSGSTSNLFGGDLFYCLETPDKRSTRYCHQLVSKIQLILHQATVSPQSSHPSPAVACAQAFASAFDREAAAEYSRLGKP